jgi:hypothetical protein
MYSSGTETVKLQYANENMNIYFFFDEPYSLLYLYDSSFSVFLLFWGIWACPNGPKKVLKGPQVGGMYGPMSIGMAFFTIQVLLKSSEIPEFRNNQQSGFTEKF